MSVYSWLFVTSGNDKSNASTVQYSTVQYRDETFQYGNEDL